MRTFRQLREKLNRHPSGQMVFNKKIDRIPVMIHKESSGFVVYLDGDRLDSYKTMISTSMIMLRQIQVLITQCVHCGRSQRMV